MEKFCGDIIEESLEQKDILKRLKIVSTRVSKVTPQHETPWLTQWTLHTVEVSENIAAEIAKELSLVLDPEHGGSWYADFKSERHHYIVYRDKIFYIDRTSLSQYQEAKQYGLTLGIPEHQVNFEELVIKSIDPLT